LRGGGLGLTSRELEVLSLAAKGLRNREIAEVLTLSLHTVERHFDKILARLNVRSRAHAAALAAAAGLLGDSPTRP
jgi:DNA-binding NarL/FixJ family response regulator